MSTNAEIYREARSWLRDIGYPIAAGQSNELVQRIVNKLYDGGWQAFLEADPDYSAEKLVNSAYRPAPDGYNAQSVAEQLVQSDIFDDLDTTPAAGSASNSGFFFDADGFEYHVTVQRTKRITT